MAAPSLSGKGFTVAFTIWWAVWTIMHTVVLIDFGVPHFTAIADSMVSNCLLAMSCLLITNNMRYYLPRREKYWYVLVVSLGLSALWLLATRTLLWLFYKQDTVYMMQLSNSSNIRYAIAFLINGSMTMMNLLWQTQKQQQESDERKAETERLAKEAELFKLRQQLQPHFLFNSLNSISALTGTQPEKARHMIQQLSDFLRGTLKKEELQWSTLEEELQSLQLYLDIEKVRFGYRLQTETILDGQALHMKLPAMLLQPIVENAIKFGLYDTIGQVTIVIDARNSNGNLEVTVQNPFDAATAQPLHGTGFGLASIKRRLFLLFARQDLLHTTTTAEHFITTVTIPQLKG